MRKAQEIIRNEILQTAAKEFAEKGYDSANINEIATKSGIGKGTIYNYFNTKKDLYLETIRQTIQLLNSISDTIYSDTESSATQKLEELIIKYFEFTDEHQAFLKLWARHLFQDAPTFSKEVAKIFQEMKHPIRDLIEEGTLKGEFETEHPLASSYMILSMLVLFTPALNAKSVPVLVPDNHRVEFAIETMKKMLGVNK